MIDKEDHIFQNVTKMKVEGCDNRNHMMIKTKLVIKDETEIFAMKLFVGGQGTLVFGNSSN